MLPRCGRDWIAAHMAKPASARNRHFAPEATHGQSPGYRRVLLRPLSRY